MVAARFLTNRIEPFLACPGKHPSLKSFFHPEAELGSSLIEFAVTLPALLLVVTGICTFGIAMNQYLMLTDATNVGARLLAVSRGNSTDPCASVSAAVYGAAPLLKTTNLTFAYVINGTSYSGTTCTGAASNLSAAQGTPARVTITYNGCNLQYYSVNSATCALQAQTAEIVQ